MERIHVCSVWIDVCSVWIDVCSVWIDVCSVWIDVRSVWIDVYSIISNSSNFSFSIFSTYTSYSLDVRYVCAGSDGNVFVTDLILSLSSGNMVLNLNPNTD